MNLHGLKEISFKEYQKIVDTVKKVSTIASANLDSFKDSKEHIYIKSHSAVSYVTKSGYMGGICKFNFASGEKVLQNHIAQRVLQYGANHAQCYEGIVSNEYLKQGFKIVARVEFNEKFAHPSFKDTFLKDKPDIVFLVKMKQVPTFKVYVFKTFDNAFKYMTTISELYKTV
tara:strand:+ start:3325 stop:3840 length:516 start_codon:yes stop_codon:yes gene_type:complete